MGTVTNLDKRPESVAALFRQLADEAQSGNITGAIIVCEYTDEITLDVPGVFSENPASLAQIVGNLEIAKIIFANMAAQPEE